VSLVAAADGRPLGSHVLSGRARAVASSADGTVVAGAGGSSVDVFRRGGKPITLAVPGATAVAVSPDGSLIAGGGTDGIGRVWSADGQLRQSLKGHAGPITDAAFSHDGTRIATSSLDGTVRIWDAGSGKELSKLPGRKGVLSVSFSPDDTLLVSAGLDHTARLWDADTGALTQVLRWHFGRVADASFSPDGKWIVTAGPATVGLWRTGTADPVLPFGFGGHKLVTSASFDPTGRFVLSSSTDGTVRRAECAVCTDLDSLLRRAKAQLASSGRVLTAEERERYGL
jgi:WD40 repeat protein